LALAASFAASTAVAADLSAREIADKAKGTNAGFGFNDASAEVTLRITTKSKEIRVRNLSMRSKRVAGLNRSLVRFTAPPDVAGTAFLSIENQSRDNDQFLYLPALGKTKRIASSQRNQSFMGTDFTYADLDSKYLSSTDVKRLPDEALDGVDCYLLDSQFSPESGSEYSRAKVWIEKSDFLARKVEFFDKNGQPWKTLHVLQTKPLEGRTVITESLMEDTRRGSKTEVSVSKLDVKARIDEDEFTEKNLSRG
jgi:hypothetical protein